MPTIGFEILSYGWRNFCLKNPPQHLIGHPNDGGVVVDQETFKAEVFADKEYAKRYYKKLNEMNALGLIDRETFTLNYDQYIAKLSSGRVLGMFDQKWNFNNANNSDHAGHGGKDLCALSGDLRRKYQRLVYGSYSFESK